MEEMTPSRRQDRFTEERDKLIAIAETTPSFIEDPQSHHEAMVQIRKHLDAMDALYPPNSDTL